MKNRRVQFVGKSSYSIVLPKSWIKENRVRSQDSLDIFSPLPYQLLIQRPLTSPLKIHYTLYGKTDQQIKREISAYYKGGVGEILITDKPISPLQVEVIRRFCRKLMNFGLFQDHKGNYFLKEISTSIAPLEILLKKSLDTIFDMHTNLLQALQTCSIPLAKEVINQDDEIDSIDLAIARQVNLCLLGLNTTCFSRPYFTFTLHYYSHISLRLERIADHLVRLAKFLVLLYPHKQFSLSRSETNNYRKIAKVLRDLNMFIFNNQKRPVHDFLDALNSEKKTVYLNQQLENPRTMNLALMESINRIKSYAANIAEETLNYLCLLEVARLPQISQTLDPESS